MTFLTIDELLNHEINSKSIMILGAPGSGKTYLSQILSSKLGIDLISTDDYIKYGFRESMYVALADAIKKESVIVEGVQGYRMLRKGLENDTYYPELIIELVSSEEHLMQIYKNERDFSKFKRSQSLALSNSKILKTYLSQVNCLVIRVKNDFLNIQKVNKRTQAERFGIEEISV